MVAQLQLRREYSKGFFRSRGGGDSDEPSVELDDRVELDAPGPGPVAVGGLDRRFELEPTKRDAEGVGASEERFALVNERSVPKGDVLFVERWPRPAVRAGARDCAKVSNAARPHASGSDSSRLAVNTASHRVSSEIDSRMRSCWCSQSIA